MYRTFFSISGTVKLQFTYNALRFSLNPLLMSTAATTMRSLLALRNPMPTTCGSSMYIWTKPLLVQPSLLAVPGIGSARSAASNAFGESRRPNAQHCSTIKWLRKHIYYVLPNDVFHIAQFVVRFLSVDTASCNLFGPFAAVHRPGGCCKGPGGRHCAVGKGVFVDGCIGRVARSRLHVARCMTCLQSIIYKPVHTYMYNVQY